MQQKPNRIAREKTIPAFEPEVQSVISRAYGEHYRAPTTGISMIIQFGVPLSSLWNDREELEIMTKVLKILPRDVFGRIKTMYCDSRAFRTFTVQVKAAGPGKDIGLERIARALDQSLRVLLSGYNRLDVFCDGRKIEMRDRWPERKEDLPDPPAGIDDFAWDFNDEPSSGEYEDWK